MRRGAVPRRRTPAFTPSSHTVPPSPLNRLRRLALALPEAHEVEAWGEPTFRVRNKLFAMYASAGNHHGGGRHAVWCKAAPGNQGLMVAAAPDRFFVPPYVGPSGWIGIWLDAGTDWKELQILLRDSYRLIAPKRLAAEVLGDGVPVVPVVRRRRAGASAAPGKSAGRKSATGKSVKRAERAKSAKPATSAKPASPAKSASKKPATSRKSRNAR